MQFRPMSNDEKLLFDEAPTLYGTSPGWFLLWCLLVPVVVGIIALVVWKISLKNTRLQISGDRVLFRTGWLSTKETEVRAQDVRDIEITKTFWQRLADTGDLSLSTSGQSGMEISIAGLKDPERVREIINASRP